MDLANVSYTLGVKRRFLPGYRKFRTLGHKNETVGAEIRLVIRTVDGALVTIPDVAKREIKVYPDFNNAMQNQKALKEQKQKDTKDADAETGGGGTLSEPRLS